MLSVTSTNEYELRLVCKYSLRAVAAFHQGHYIDRGRSIMASWVATVRVVILFLDSVCLTRAISDLLPTCVSSRLCSNEVQRIHICEWAMYAPQTC